MIARVHAVAGALATTLVPGFLVSTVTVELCAVTLRALAEDGVLGATFAAVQALELTGGAVNLTLLTLNARDGWRLAAARRARRSTHPSASK